MYLFLLYRQSFARIAHPKSYGGGLHGHYGRYAAYDSQEWWPSFEEHGQRLYSRQ